MLAVAFAEPPVPRSSYLPPQGRNSNAPSNQYGPPAQARTNYNAPAPRSQYGAPQQQQPRNGFAQPSSNYGPPATQTKSFSAPSNQYGPPAQPSNQYGPPAQGRTNYAPPSTSYGVPAAQDFNNFDSQRANSYQQAPSNAYGVPAEQNSYTQNDNGNSYAQQSSYSNTGNAGGSGYVNGGYEEPAKYEFQYDVQDEQAALDFGHKEQREGSVATGKYYVLLPDGRKQVRTLCCSVVFKKF